MSKIETLLNEQNESNEQSNEQSNKQLNERNERKNSKKRKNSYPLFNKEDDKMIISLKKMGKSYSEIYKEINEINEKIGKDKFSPKQIRQRWRNHLDPELCQKPFDEEEKEFILQWVEEHKEIKSDGIVTIRWNDLISEMKDEFKKFRSENKIKNFYYLRKRITAGRITPNLVATTDFDPFKSSLIQKPAKSSPPPSAATDIDPFKSSLKLPLPTPTAGIAYNFAAFDPHIPTKSSIYFEATIFHAFTPSFLEPPTIVEPPKFRKLKLTFDF